MDSGNYADFLRFCLSRGLWLTAATRSRAQAKIFKKAEKPLRTPQQAHRNSLYQRNIPDRFGDSGRLINFKETYHA